MKYHIFALLFVFPLLTVAQIQNGKVKTIGRPGKPGVGLSGALISFNNKINSITSGNNGTFSFKTKNGEYVFAGVKLGEDYVLADNDIIGRKYHASVRDTMNISMVNKKDLEEEKARIVRNTKRVIQDKFNKLYDDLEAEKKSSTMKEDEYKKKLKELDEKLENQVELLKLLADAYARVDYDTMDSLKQQFNYYIENGDIDAAKRLNNACGSKEQYERKIQEDQEEIDLLKTTTDAALQKKANHISEYADRLYRDYTISVCENEPDSALYYLEERAAQDTTNIQYQMDVARFIIKRASDEDYISKAKASSYATRALNLSITQAGEKSLLTADCYELLTDCNEPTSKTSDLNTNNDKLYQYRAQKILEIKKFFKVDSLKDYIRVAYSLPYKKAKVLIDSYIKTLPEDMWLTKVNAAYIIATKFSEGKVSVKELDTALKLFRSHISTDSLINNRQEFNIVYEIYSGFVANLKDLSRRYEFMTKRLILLEDYQKKDNSIAISSFWDYQYIIIASIKLNKYNEAIAWGKKCLQLSKWGNGLENLQKAWIYNQIITAYTEIDGFTEAEHYFKEGMYKLSQRNGAYYHYDELYEAYAMLLFKKGSYQDAINVCNRLIHDNHHVENAQKIKSLSIKGLQK